MIYMKSVQTWNGSEVSLKRDCLELDFTLIIPVCSVAALNIDFVGKPLNNATFGRNKNKRLWKIILFYHFILQVI